jgi:hypothetical protein
MEKIPELRIDPPEDYVDPDYVPCDGCYADDISGLYLFDGSQLCRDCVLESVFVALESKSLQPYQVQKDVERLVKQFVDEMKRRGAT